MTPRNDLELQGNFLTHPFAELVAEIAQAQLTGSLRVSDKEKKSVVYFKSGRVVFAVSNARTSRLFDILLRRDRFTKEDIARIPNFANDLEFADHLVQTGLLTNEAREKLFVEQIDGILIDSLSWNSGDWSFSHLARIRDGLVFETNIDTLLIDYARCMTVDAVLGRFRSLNETFERCDLPAARFALNLDEIKILSKFANDPISAENLIAMAGLPEATTVKVLYTLWLGGLLQRTEWNPAFSEMKIASILDAKLEIKQESKHHAPRKRTEETAEESVVVTDGPVEVSISLDEYLERIETAETHYDILGVEPAAEVSEIKRSYFALAKAFHPDHYYKDGGTMLQRVQNAFTELTHAHETLKNPETRETYDFKVRKELADREKLRSAGTYDDRNRQLQQGAESFERGFSFLMDKETEAAIPFLARAVHFDPKNARYHAYYGKALAADPKMRHKAESEMQAALRLDPNNPTFRILLAEFFISVNLLKRAEGELTRLLAVFPSNREGRELLETLRK